MTIFWLCISDLCKTFILEVNVVNEVNSCYGLNATVAQYFPICIQSVYFILWAFLGLCCYLAIWFSKHVFLCRCRFIYVENHT